jgi:hypothetical protein
VSEWLKVDPYHMRTGDWTISKAHSEVPKPYGLWHGAESKGFYATSADALKQWGNEKCRLSS